MYIYVYTYAYMTYPNFNIHHNLCAILHREGKDKKYGMLGKPAYLKKRNDAKSAADTRDFKPFKKGGGSSGSSPSPSSFKRGRNKEKSKKPNRPGKASRDAKRQRTH